MSIKFYNPDNSIGTTDLGVTQINKLVPFKTVNGVYISNPTITVYSCKNIVKQFTLGDGLELTGTNTQGTEKTLTLTLNGPDFQAYRGNVLDVKCTFFIEGDIEIIFKLKII